MAGKNRDKILDIALQLFNDEGARVITTNHIARSAGISPGNLYYHFRNKDAIILALLEQFQKDLVARIVLPQNRAMTFEDKREYLELLLSSMWRYRFMFRDLHGVLARSEALQAMYRDFARMCIGMIRQVFRGLIAAGLMEASEDEQEALALNTFMVLTSWHEFVYAVLKGEEKEPPKALLDRVIYQILILDRGFITREALPSFKAMEGSYYTNRIF